jgi:DNA-binding Lrp family transcriptional regulator
MAVNTNAFVPEGKEINLDLSMPVAFVLINAEMGFEDEVVTELRKLSSVKEAYGVYGLYDIVAKVEADSMDELKETVTWKIRRLSNVRSTLTIMVVQGNYLS